MKKILKKVRVLSIGLLSIALAVTFFGCPGEGGGTRTATTRQQQIDYAAAGSTVTLNASFTDTTIRINKALTVNGNNISGLTVIVNSSVRNNVTLSNFNNATISIASSSRSALDNRGARAAEATGAHGNELKTLGDNSVPIFLENCSIEKIDAEADFSLYLEPGEDKTVIEELNLKEGLENFTFVEIDGSETGLTDKSKVERLNIENGFEEINLIGGTFDDVDFANDFTGSVEFNYDKEFVDDQLHFDDVNAFFADAKVEENDVAIVDNNEQTLSGVWKITLNKADLDNYFNGYVSIVLLKQAQINIMTRQPPYNNVNIPIEAYAYELFNADNPLYCLTSVGDFQYDESNTNALKTLAGSERYAYYPSLVDGEWGFEQVFFQHYPNYPKESVIAKQEGTGTDTTITYYVNLDTIKKTDLIIAANSESSAIGGAGSKASYVELAGYKPYLAVNWGKFCEMWNSSDAVVAGTESTADSSTNNAYEIFADGIWDDVNNEWAQNGDAHCIKHITSNALSPSVCLSMAGRPFDIPIYDTVQFESGTPRLLIFPMTDASSEGYPNVSSVQYSTMDVPND